MPFETLDDTAINAFLELVFDHVCAQPLSSLIEVDRVLEAIATVATPQRLSVLQRRFLVPLRERILARGKTSAITLAAFIPESLVDPIADLIGAPFPLPPKLIDEVIASEQVRNEVRAMLDDALSSFVKKATGGGGEKPGSLRDVLGRGARTFGAVSKGLLGGLGDELQRQMQERVRDFVDGSVAALQERIAKKLKSEETTKAFAERRRQGFLELLKKTEAEAVAMLEPVPFAAVDAFAPLVAAHNVGRSEVRAALRVEIGHALSEMSKSTLGEQLDELGLRDQARAAFVTRGLPLARSLVSSKGFVDWFSRVAEKA